MKGPNAPPRGALARVEQNGNHGNDQPSNELDGDDLNLPPAIRCGKAGTKRAAGGVRIAEKTIPIRDSGEPRIGIGVGESCRRGTARLHALRNYDDSVCSVCAASLTAGLRLSILPDCRDHVAGSAPSVTMNHIASCNVSSD